MANSDNNYVVPANYTAYFTARQNAAALVFDDDEILAAGIVASEWLDARYGMQFSGTKVGLREQIREQPRNGQWDWNYASVPADAIPREVLQAAYQATFRQLVNPGSLSKDYVPNKYKRVSIDGAISVEYAGFNVAADIQTQFNIIDQIIAPLLTGSGFGAMSGLSGDSVRI